MSDEFGGCARSRRHRPRARAVSGRLLLARSRRLHLEHQDDGRPGADRARCWSRSWPTVKPSAWTRRYGAGDRSGRRHDRLVHIRDGVCARQRAIRAEGRADLDAAHHHDRTQGPRGTERLQAADGRRSTARASIDRRAGRKSARKKRATLGYDEAAVLPDRRRRAGRHRARRAAAGILGVPTIIIDKNERPGDRWRKRYKSLCLHDPVWYDHMPYLPFPRTGRCSRPRTRSATGSRCTRRSWS